VARVAEDVLEIADELYALGLGDFTSARDAKAKELKGTPLAAEVKALKKPSLAAWVVNLLVRQDAEQVAQVLTVGASLREAAANLDGAELRALTKQRRQLTAAVTTGARSLAASSGVKVTSAVSDQVEATLTAAMLDEDCAAAVRSGLLVSALSSNGVDASDLASAVAVPDALGFEAAPAPPPPRPNLSLVPDPPPDTDDEKRAAQEAAARAAAAERKRLEADVRAAKKAVDKAARAVSRIEAKVLQASSEIEELKSRLAEKESAAEVLREQLAEAEDTRDEAESDLRDSESALED
jgi:hypothetical protein